MKSYDSKKSTHLSKFLSLVLRHQPERIHIQLDPQGWVSVDHLITQVNKSGHNLDLEWLQFLVASSDKQRFAFSPDGTRIRANQGHSTQVDLGLQAIAPPEFLLHGTVQRFLPLIQADGLLKMSRHHVHLSKDLATAEQVGGRRGEAVILKVKAGEMHAAGFSFFCSENGVWLTDHVPPAFIVFPDPKP